MVKFFSSSVTLNLVGASISFGLNLFEPSRRLFSSGMDVDMIRSSNLESASGLGGDVKKLSDALLLPTSEAMPAKTSDDCETYDFSPISGLPCVIKGDLEFFIVAFFTEFGSIGIGIALVFLYLRPWYSPFSALFMGIVISLVLGLHGNVSFIFRVGDCMRSLSSFDSGSRPITCVVF